MITKRNLWLTLLMAAVLLATPAFFTGCVDAPVKPPDNNGGNNQPGPNPRSWTVEQIGGSENSKTTALKLTFADAVENLTAQEVTVSGAAAVKAGASPVKGTGDDYKAWTIEVAVTETGDAQVTVNKAGVEAVWKTVKVFIRSVVGAGEYANSQDKDPAYTGTPFVDANYPATMPKPAPDQPDGQKIPGKVMLAFYDVGGQGVAFNDINGANAGSGALNGGSAYKDRFRMGNPVPDTSYMKTGFDMSSLRPIEPDGLDMFYLGWTNAGEWVKCTVNIETTGIYEVKLLYTANDANSFLSIEFDSDKVFKHNPTQTNDYHRWGKEVMVEQMELREGIFVLTTRIVDWGSMNLCYVEFTLIG